MAMYKSIKFIGIGLLFTTSVCWLLAWKLDDWLHTATQNYITKKTNYGVTLQSLHTDLKHGIVEIHGLNLTNPDEFLESRFIRFNEIKLHINLFSLLSNTVIFDEIVLDIDELVGVRNAQGKTNIQAFSNALKKSYQGNNQSVSATKKKANSSKDFLIHRLFFRLGELTVADFKEDKEAITSHHVGVARVFNNVNNYSQILIPLVSDLSSFATTFILDSILHSTLDSKAYSDVIPKIVKPFKDSLQKAKSDTEKFLEKLLGDKKNNSSSSQPH
jgi:hypothetical protein